MQEKVCIGASLLALKPSLTLIWKAALLFSIFSVLWESLVPLLWSCRMDRAFFKEFYLSIFGKFLALCSVAFRTFDWTLNFWCFCICIILFPGSKISIIGKNITIFWKLLKTTHSIHWITGNYQNLKSGKQISVPGKFISFWCCDNFRHWNTKKQYFGSKTILNNSNKLSLCCKAIKVSF